MPWWIHIEWGSEEDALPADKTSTADKTREFDLFCLFSDFNLFSFSFNSASMKV